LARQAPRLRGLVLEMELPEEPGALALLGVGVGVEVRNPGVRAERSHPGHRLRVNAGYGGGHHDDRECDRAACSRSQLESPWTRSRTGGSSRPALEGWTVREPKSRCQGEAAALTPCVRSARMARVSFTSRPSSHVRGGVAQLVRAGES